jgi:hypothetical protein
VAAAEQVQADDHHDQPQRQPHPDVALHRRGQLGAQRAEQAHPAPVGLPPWIMLVRLHRLPPGPSVLTSIV